MFLDGCSGDTAITGALACPKQSHESNSMYFEKLSLPQIKKWKTFRWRGCLDKDHEAFSS